MQSPIEYCNEDQISELKSLISQCDPDKQDAFIKFLESKMPNGKLEKKSFAPIQVRLLAQRNEYQDKLLSQIPVQKEEEVEDGTN